MTDRTFADFDSAGRAVLGAARIEASIGLAMRQGAAGLAGALVAADRLMYEDKRAP